jgi:nitrogen fixation protein NifB
MSRDLSNHPCFNAEVKHRYGRIHLPVTPQCNVRCNFCSRKYDCLNESRPGVTSSVLSPGQALHYLRKMYERDSRLSVVGIAGPGDAFANVEETLETLRLVRAEFPEMLLCVATNGLNAPVHIAELARIGGTHVTITVNAVDPEIGARIYGWVRDGKKILHETAGAQLLLERQIEAIGLCKAHDLTVKINSILIPGVNDHHIIDVAKKVSELGADLFNCIGMCSVPGTPFEEIPEPERELVESARSEARKYMPQMSHCTRCRADAVGCLGDKVPGAAIKLLREAAAGPINPGEERPYTAVTSMEGLLVNQHLGQAKHLWIFKPSDSGFELVETRQTPPGGGEMRWRQLAGVLRDCRAVLTAAAGDKPVQALKQAGIRVGIVEGLIERSLEIIYSGGDLDLYAARGRCGSCAGGAKGCM